MKQIKADAEKVDESNPEWTDEMFDKATSIEESELPEAFKVMVQKGRPKLDNPKQAISIRLTPEVLDYFKATGKGWQTRVNAVLSEYVESHQ